MGYRRFYYTFWRSPLDNGKSLSAFGHKLLSQKLQVTFHKLDVMEFTSSMIKGLYQKLDGPFFKKGAKLFLYDEKDVVILHLYGESMKAYLTHDL
jgi:hypothetical protein